MGMTSFSCPHCRRIIKMTDGIHTRLEDIGNPLMSCPHCNGLIKTGAKEWIDLSKERKFGIWFKTHIVYGLIYGALLGFAVGSLIVGVFKIPLNFGIAGGIIVFILIFYLMHKGYKNEIQESLKRKSIITKNV